MKTEVTTFASLITGRDTGPVVHNHYLTGFIPVVKAYHFKHMLHARFPVRIAPYLEPRPQLPVAFYRMTDDFT